MDVWHLRPTEMYDETHARKLHAEIERHGRWTAPILVLDDPSIVLDGHHRLAVSRSLGLSSIPCIVVSRNDPQLSLECWRQGEVLTMDDVISRGVNGQLLPPKTTRFRHAGVLPACEINLMELKACQK